MEGVDIVVTSNVSHRPELVVEVKLSGSIDHAADQLKRYMERSGVPLGLAVVGHHVRLLRDTYASPQAIEVVLDAVLPDGELPDTWSKRHSEPWLDFEARVQAWLESLPNPASLSRIPEPHRAVLRDQLVPIIENGTVSAAGPRLSRKRAS